MNPKMAVALAQAFAKPQYKPVPIPFVGQAYTASSLDLNAQRCINFILESGGDQGASQAALIPSPGLTRLVQFPNGNVEVRGSIVFRGFEWVVAGNTLFRVDTSFNAISIGNLATSIGPVSMDSSETQLGLVDGDRGYYYDFPSSTFAVITDAGFPSGAAKITYLAAQFVVETPNTEQFSWSALADITSWPGLNFASAEKAPDPIVAHAANFGELYLIGESTTEVWIPDSLGFISSGNAFIQQGCCAPFSVQPIDNALMWLAKDKSGQGIVIRVDGYVPKRVSTFGVENAIAEMAETSRIDDAIAYAYQQKGHNFYVLTFPTAGQTWCYDAATGEWAERLAFNSATGELTRHRSNCYSFFAGKCVVGDYANGRLYALDLNNYTDDGDTIMRLRSTPVEKKNGQVLTFGSLVVDIEAGVGLVDGQGDMPLMMMRYSDDGGHTWSNRRTASMGKVGKYGARAKWNRLGQGKNRVWEVSVTDPVKVVIIDANAEVQIG